MKSAAALIRIGVVPACCVVAVAVSLQLAPAPVEASSPVASPIDAADILPLLPAPGPALGPGPVMPATAEPGALFELTLRTHDKSDLVRQLIDAGAASDDARHAADLLRTRLGHATGADMDLKLGLGKRAADGGRAIHALALITDAGMERIERREHVLVLATAATARSVSAPVKGGTYWSLRAAGLEPELAAEAAELAEQKLGGGPAVIVKVLVGERPARFGTATTPRLLYIAVERPGQPARRLLSWPGAGESWIDPDRIAPPSSALARPVAGRVTSGFGARFHPILHFFRAHRGVDFAARSGDPVRATADGCVIAAGWSGGYGRQVRLAHRGGIASSYAHLSSLSVGAGECVRRGDIIGLAGASGLATGVHLHFELHRAGKAVDPLRQLTIPGAVDGTQRQAIAARLARFERAAS